MIASKTTEPFSSVEQRAFRIFHRNIAIQWIVRLFRSGSFTHVCTACLLAFSFVSTENAATTHHALPSMSASFVFCINSAGSICLLFGSANRSSFHISWNSSENPVKLEDTCAICCKQTKLQQNSHLSNQSPYLIDLDAHIQMLSA